MKRVLTSLCILGLLAWAGCSDNTANMTPQQKQYVSDMQLKLDQLTKQIDDMKRKGGSLSGDARTAMDKTIADARTKVGEAQDKLADLKKASAQEWDKAKADLEAAWKSATSSLTQGMPGPPMPK